MSDSGWFLKRVCKIALDVGETGEKKRSRVLLILVLVWMD